MSGAIQGSAKRLRPGLVNFVTAVAELAFSIHATWDPPFSRVLWTDHLPSIAPQEHPNELRKTISIARPHKCEGGRSGAATEIWTVENGRMGWRLNNSGESRMGQVTMGEWNVWGRSLFLPNYEMTAPPPPMEMEKIERK